MNTDKLWKQIKEAVKAMEAVKNPPPKSYVETRKGNIIRRCPKTA